MNKITKDINNVVINFNWKIGEEVINVPATFNKNTIKKLLKISPDIFDAKKMSDNYRKAFDNGEWYYYVSDFIDNEEKLNVLKGINNQIWDEIPEFMTDDDIKEMESLSGSEELQDTSYKGLDNNKKEKIDELLSKFFSTITPDNDLNYLPEIIKVEL